MESVSTAGAVPRASHSGNRHVDGAGRLYKNGATTRDRIIGRCRDLLIAGNFRPTQKDICFGTISLKALRYHFDSLPHLVEAAIADHATSTAILSRVMPNGPWPAAEDCSRIVRAIVWGRVT